jgi:hypothetical protein
VHNAVLPAVMPDSATDFLGLKVADGASLLMLILR